MAISEKLHIKNMVCNRCIEAVKEEFEKSGILIKSVILGEVIVEGNISDDQKDQLAEGLKNRGFELLKNKESQLIEKIKNLIISTIHYQDEPIKINYSTYLEQEIGKDYTQLSSLFSSIEGITIEKYIILQRLEKVKEFLIYDELNLSEIAYRLGYSSVQHLSNQFKKVTGMSPSEFKKISTVRRRPIDHIKD